MGILRQLFSACTHPAIKDYKQDHAEQSLRVASHVLEQGAAGNRTNSKSSHPTSKQQTADAVHYSAASVSALATVFANTSNSDPPCAEPPLDIHPCVARTLTGALELGSVMRVPPQQLVKDVSNCRWIGQGSQGVVYEGTWQGASVAVKWSLTDQAVDINAFELVVSRMLGHPNVVQTYNAKVATLDEQIFEPVSQPLEDSGRLHTLPALPDSMPDMQRISTRTLSHQTLSRLDSFQSDEGFGSPFGRPSNFQDLRDLLRVIGARPNQCITQLIMECCDQGSLLAAIVKGIFLPTNKFGPKVALRALLRTAREVAQGMLHMHEANVVHGDLKPANVLLMNSRKDRRGFVAKVSDFGLAQICAASSTIEDAPWGTLVFQAPERFYTSGLSPAADVWSFGVMVWQMYTAKLPYEGAKQSELIAGVTTNTLHLTWPPGSPPSLMAIVADCMRFKPTERPTFSELVKNLAAAESDVRLEGHRLSNSIENLTLQLPGRFSQGALEMRSNQDSRSASFSVSSVNDAAAQQQITRRPPRRSPTDLQQNIRTNRHSANTSGLKVSCSMTLHNSSSHAGGSGGSAPVSPSKAGKLTMRETAHSRSVLASRRMQYAGAGSQPSGHGSGSLSMASCHSSMDWQSNAGHAGQAIQPSKSASSTQALPDACVATAASSGQLQLDAGVQRLLSGSTAVDLSNVGCEEIVEGSWACSRNSSSSNNNNNNNNNSSRCMKGLNNLVAVPEDALKSVDLQSAGLMNRPGPWSGTAVTANISARQLHIPAVTRAPGFPTYQQQHTAVAQIASQGLTTPQHSRPVAMSRLRKSSGEGPGL